MEMGENSGMDMREPFAEHGNKILEGEGEDTYLDLGEEHGLVQAKYTRLRAAIKEGHLDVYIRQKAEEHPVITATVALGIVAAGIYALKHRKK